MAAAFTMALPTGRELPGDGRFYLCPQALLTGQWAAAAVAAGQAMALAPAGLACQSLMVGWRTETGAAYTMTGVTAADLQKLSRWATAVGWQQQLETVLTALRGGNQRPSCTSDRPQIMGVLNVTPDSFSDAGQFHDPADAIAQGRAMAAAGADIIDVGGESTRPGAAPVPVDLEINRVVPVIRGLRDLGTPISIDSRHAAVMRAALAAGASIINDVTALTGDAGSLAVARQSGRPVIMMHMQGQPADMQLDPRYHFAPFDVYDWLADRIDVAVAAGIAPSRLIVDPGYGFGKTIGHNLQLLDWLSLFLGLDCALLVGVSRKSSIAKIAFPEAPERLPAEDRLPGSLALGLAAVGRGASIVRVHDVAETAQALRLWQAVSHAAQE